MAPSRLGFSALALSCWALWASPSHAYNDRTTHPWIARQAVQYLVSLYPGDYDEVLDYIDPIAEGSTHEDDLIIDGDQDPLTLRVMRHFYRPTDEKGFGSESWGEFPNSYEWGIVGSEQNQWDYQDALEHYQRGNLEEAYFALGHALHLLADLTVPAHTHLDEHGPPLGDDYENYCSDNSISAFDATLPTPYQGTPLPSADTVEELWDITANASYWRNMFEGSLEGESADGTIAAMFPDIELNWLSMKWTIPGVGSLGDAFIEEVPHYFYFAKLGATPAYIRDFSIENPGGQALVANDGGKAMVESVADDMVPMAIVHSAALIKLFLDEARTRPELPPEEPGEGDPGSEGSGREDAADYASCSTTGPNGSLALYLGLLLIPLIVRRRSYCH